MAKQTIDLGTVANDHTGTTLLAGGDMINDNFTELYNAMQIGVYASLSVPAETTIIEEGDNYSYITGTFNNNPIEGFEFVSTPYAGIKYTGTTAYFFEIDIHCSLSAATNGTTVTMGIKRDDGLDEGSLMTSFCKYAGEVVNMSTTSVLVVQPDQIISLVVTSDNFAAVTFNKFTTTIKPFII